MDALSEVLRIISRSPEDLQRVLDLLDSYGLPAEDIRLTYREAAPRL